MKIYKVVRNVEGKLMSANQNLPNFMQLEYKPGEWTYPIAGTLLYCYPTLLEAMEFNRCYCENWPGLETWEAEADEAPKECSIIDYYNGYPETLEELKTEWEIKNNFSRSYPNRAYTVPAIKLVSKL